MMVSGQNVKTVGEFGHLALLNEFLISNKTYKFWIKKKRSSLMAVGVCYKQRVEQAGFQYVSDDPYHGCFLFCSNGSQYKNGILGAFKLSNQKVSFDTHDIIAFYYNLS